MMASAATNIMRDRWFEDLFGFNEAKALMQKLPDGQVVRKTAQVRDWFELNGEQLVAPNGASFGAGRFSTPSLAELRAAAAHLPAGTLTLEHVATSDIFSEHSRPENKGSTFMAASQFNCLEFPNEMCTPEDGIFNYIYDGTQGPACALAAPAATVVRNYFVDVGGGQRGQTEEKQLNLLGDLLQLAQGSDGEQWQRVDGAADDARASLTRPKVDLVTVRNGYTSSDDTRLMVLNQRLAALPRDELLGQLRLGLHQGVEVPWGPTRFELLPPSQRQAVSQAFCSAISVGYSDGKPANWEPLARIVLGASYEATLLAAALEHAEGRGSGQVVLTFLGGGVFANPREWIFAAIARACVRLEGLPLRVVVSHHGGVSAAAVVRLNQAIAAERESQQQAGKEEV